MSEIAALNYKNMDRSYFTEEHYMFRESLRKFLEKEAAPYFETWEEKEFIPRTFWKKMGGKGFLCSWVDPKYGGLGLDFPFSIILAEELARIGGGMVALALHSDVIAPYIANYGTEEQKKRYLPVCISGETVLAIAMSEPGTGSDLSNISTTAVKDGDHFIINGQKTFISNAIQADLFIVACKTDPKANPPHRGISLFLIEKDTEGFSIGRKLKKLGMRSQDTAELHFDNVKIPASNLLGEEGKGFYYLLNKLVQERIIACCRNQVMSEEMLKMTVQYVKERKAFGQPISKFQNTQFVLSEIATEVQLGRTFLDDIIAKYIYDVELKTEVSMAKWWIAETAKKIASKCLQLHGGYGFMEEYQIARYYRDVAVSSISAGSSEVMKVIISRNMGL